MGFKWEVDPKVAFEDLAQNYAQTIFTTGRIVAQQRAGDMVEWCQENAVWTDRTGDARRTLHADVADSPGVATTITLAHGVPYGIWLEIANQGRFAIIAPAIDHWAPIIMQDIQRLINLGLVTR